MNAPQPKTCTKCGGSLAPRAEAGRLIVYRGERDYLIPADTVIPTCTKCGTMWPGSNEAEVLTAELERQRAERQRGATPAQAQAGATTKADPQARTDPQAGPQSVMPVAIPLDDIVADYDWNARSGDYRTSDSDAEEGKGTLGIAESMEARGQDEAVNVRPHPGQRGKFQLVDGFRRFSAAGMLRARGSRIKGLPAAHLLCLVTEMTDADARMLNLAKGCNRDNLKPADLAFAIADALRLGKTVDQISREIGKHKTYVSNLAHVANPLRFDKRLFDDWRQKGLPITVDDIQLNIFQKNVPLEKQAEVIAKVIAGKKKKGQGRHGSTTWSDVAGRHARELGWSLGRLVHQGLIPDAVVDWEKAVVACVSLGRHGRKSEHRSVNARPDQVATLAQAAAEAYAAGKAGEISAWKNRLDGYQVARDRKRRAGAGDAEEKTEDKSSDSDPERDEDDGNDGGRDE